jgi:hypothetical protein
MNKVLCLAFLMALPIFAFGQARNTGIKLKGPLYQDAVLILTRTQVQVRAEIPFYAYSLAAETYKAKPSTPLLLGIRYERLGRADIGFGVELEYNGYTAKKNETDPELSTPRTQQTIKFSPMARKYFRSYRGRKNIFRGLFLQGGPTLMFIQQLLEDNLLPQKTGIWRYKSASIFGMSAGAGIQHTIGPNFTMGVAGEVIFGSQQFVQEGYTKRDIGNGALYINPFKFYIGARF